MQIVHAGRRVDEKPSDLFTFLVKCLHERSEKGVIQAAPSGRSSIIVMLQLMKFKAEGAESFSQRGLCPGPQHTEWELTMFHELLSIFLQMLSVGRWSSSFLL